MDFSYIVSLVLFLLFFIVFYSLSYMVFYWTIFPVSIFFCFKYMLFYCLFIYLFIYNFYSYFLFCFLSINYHFLQVSFIFCVMCMSSAIVHIPIPKVTVGDIDFFPKGKEIKNMSNLSGFLNLKCLQSKAASCKPGCST